MTEILRDCCKPGTSNRGFSAGFPEVVQDADPLEGQGADGGVMLHSAGGSLVVEGSRPRAPFAVVIGKLAEGLLHKLRACETLRHRLGLPTLPRDRCNPRVGRHAICGLETLAVGTESGTGSGARAEDLVVRMLRDRRLQLGLELGDGRIEVADLSRVVLGQPWRASLGDIPQWDWHSTKSEDFWHECWWGGRSFLGLFFGLCIWLRFSFRCRHDEHISKIKETNRPCFFRLSATRY